MLMTSKDVTREPRLMKGASALIEAGHSVTVIGFSRDGSESAWAVYNGIQLRRLDPFYMKFSRWLKARQGKEIAQRLIQEEWTSEQSSGHISLRKCLRSVLVQIVELTQLVTVLLLFSVEAMRCHADVFNPHDYNTLLPALVAGFIGRRPVVYESHEYWYQVSVDKPIVNRITRLIERISIPRCAQTIVVSMSIAERMVEHYSISKPTVVLNVPVDTKVEPPRPLMQGDRIELVYHGGFLKYRGIENLIEAVPLIAAHVHLILRGFGDLEPVLRNRVWQLGLKDRVSFESPVPMDQITIAASKSHIGIIPYSESIAQYALPNKLFEYMAAGLAVVTNDLIEFRKVVTEHSIGLVCNSEDPQELASIINLLAGDVHRLNTMRMNSWMAYRNHYTWTKQKEILMKVYSDIADNSVGIC